MCTVPVESNTEGVRPEGHWMQGPRRDRTLGGIDLPLQADAAMGIDDGNGYQRRS